MSGDTSATSPDWWLVEVPHSEAGSRLDRFLRRAVPGLTQGPIEKMLRSGLIRVDGARAKPAARLEAGQILRLPPHLRDSEPPRKINQTAAATPRLRAEFAEMIVAEGDSWIAINKPSGLAVQGGSGTSRHIDGMLQSLAGDAPDRMRLVHRIDRDTSGLLLLARSRAAARSLTAAFAGRDVEKTYLALVAGKPPASLRITDPLLKKGRAGLESMVVDPGGQSAQSEMRLIESAGQSFSLVALRPHTGRTHQLRVHMAHVGHAIVGDPKYGGARGGAAGRGGAIARRLHLHAWRLRLPEGRQIEAPLPPHFLATLDSLGLAVPASDWQFA
jgi:23S rRNA pseudouridine955/2504/2580 synthase